MRQRWLHSMLRTVIHGSKPLFGLFSPPTVATVAGLVLMGYGLHAIYPPLPYIVIGFGLLTFGLWLAGLSLAWRKHGDQ